MSIYDADQRVVALKHSWILYVVCMRQHMVSEVHAIVCSLVSYFDQHHYSVFQFDSISIHA